MLSAFVMLEADRVVLALQGFVLTWIQNTNESTAQADWPRDQNRLFGWAVSLCKSSALSSSCRLQMSFSSLLEADVQSPHTWWVSASKDTSGWEDDSLGLLL